MDGELRPRLCFITKGERGYGFHLHGERSKGGQFIRKVEAGSCAELAGLRAGDRVVEVNGENVENETHHEVVQRIREVDFRTRLLVVDRETDEYLHSEGLACTEDLAIELGNLSPRPSPANTPSSSPIPPSLLRENGVLSPRTARSYALSTVHPLTISHSPTPTVTDGPSSRNSVASSITTEAEVSRNTLMLSCNRAESITLTNEFKANLDLAKESGHCLGPVLGWLDLIHQPHLSCLRPDTVSSTSSHSVFQSSPSNVKEPEKSLGLSHSS